MKIKQGQKATMSMPISIKSIDKEKFTLTMVASTQDTDRHGDVILQAGWDLSQFNNNPVILNSHNYGDVCEVIARATRSEIVGKGKRAKLEQDWEFAVKENPKAKIAFDLYAGGFLSASSVGFIPKKFKENQDGTRDWWTIEEAELLEVSAVSVPANARALAKAKGIDIDALYKENEQEDDDDESTEQDAKSGAEGDDDELSEGDEVPEADEEEPATDGDEVPEADEEEPATDGDDSESEQAPANEEAEEHPRDTAGQPVVPPAEAEPITASYRQKVAGVLTRINEQERTQLKKVADIVASLLNEDKPAIEQVRKRKYNQAIRMLMKTK